MQYPKQDLQTFVPLVLLGFGVTGSFVPDR